VLPGDEPPAFALESGALAELHGAFVASPSAVDASKKSATKKRPVKLASAKRPRGEPAVVAEADLSAVLEARGATWSEFEQPKQAIKSKVRAPLDASGRAGSMAKLKGSLRKCLGILKAMMNSRNGWVRTHAHAHARTCARSQAQPARRHARVRVPVHARTHARAVTHARVHAHRQTCVLTDRRARACAPTCTHARALTRARAHDHCQTRARTNARSSPTQWTLRSTRTT
jgi:hypothetical protein